MRIDWKTPQDLFATLDREFHFGTDVCALPWNAQCERYFTPEADGLAQAWEGTCWCNPPFDRERARWIKKAWHEAQRGVTTVVLVNGNGTCDTEWWHRYALRCSEIRCVRGRPSFADAQAVETSTRVMLLVFRPHCEGPPVCLSVDRTGKPYTSNTGIREISAQSPGGE